MMKPGGLLVLILCKIAFGGSWIIVISYHFHKKIMKLPYILLLQYIFINSTCKKRWLILSIIVGYKGGLFLLKKYKKELKRQKVPKCCHQKWLIKENIMVKSHIIVPRISNLQTQKHAYDTFHLPSWVSTLLNYFLAFVCLESILIAIVLIGTGVFFVKWSSTIHVR